MNRRQFLRIFSASILGTASMGFLWKSGWLQYLGRQLFVPELDVAAATGILPDDELETVVSFGEVLVKGSPLSVEEREYLVEHIVYQGQNKPGYLSLYRLTAQHLDQLAGGRFAKLEFEARKQTMTNHDLISSSIRAHEYLLAFDRKELQIRSLAISDLIAGFYNSPAGWALVGYTAFPGRCGNLTRYTRPGSA